MPALASIDLTFSMFPAASRGYEEGVVRLEPLYRLSFRYAEEYGVDIEGPRGQESQYWFLGQGQVEGRLSGRFHGANYPRRRTDNTFMPDMRSVIVKPMMAPSSFRNVAATVVPTHQEGDRSW